MFTSSFKKILVYIVVGLATLVVGASVMRGIYEKPNWKTMAIDELDGSHKVAFIGSSRFFFGIDPREIPGESITLAGDYLDATSAERLWRKYGEQMLGLRVVFLEGGLSPIFYDTARLAPNVLRDFDLPVFATWQSILRDPAGWLRELVWPLWRWRWNPGFWERHQRHRSNPSEPKDAYPGFVPSNLELSYPEDMAKAKVAEAREVLAQHAPDHVARNKAAMRRLIRELFDRKFEVVYLRMPIHRAVWSQFPPEWEALVAAEILDLQLLFPRLRIRDESRRPGLGAEMFRDPDHLNAKGARAFSRVLANYMESFGDIR